MGEPLGETRGGVRVDVAESDGRYAFGGERRGDGRADSAGADDQAARACEVEPLAREAAAKPYAVEHVTPERPVLPLHNGVA